MKIHDLPVKECSLCHKKVENINVLVEVIVEAFARYRRDDNLYEDMNGLWKKVAEFFCEDCFKEYAATLEALYAKHREIPKVKKSAASKKS